MCITYVILYNFNYRPPDNCTKTKMVHTDDIDLRLTDNGALTASLIISM